MTFDTGPKKIGKTPNLTNKKKQNEEDKEE